MYFGGTRAVCLRLGGFAGNADQFISTRLVCVSSQAPNNPALPRWEYATPGPLRERLNGLTLAGAKTTTFGLEVFEEIDGEEPPTVGDQSVMIGTNGTELAIVEVVAHVTMRLADVPWALANAEGESFVDVADWRTAHERFWEQFLSEIREHTGDPGWVVNDDTIVTCTHVRVVRKLPAADSARFPVVECVISSTDVEWVSAELIDLDATGIEEIAGGPGIVTTNEAAVRDGEVVLRAGFGTDDAAVAAEAELNRLDRSWRARYEVLLGDEWLDAWREYFEPQRIGRVLVVGDWDGADPVIASAASDVVLRLDPARSFGTGAHQSTRLMIDALQRIDLNDAAVLDVGCGSGVLSIAALLLGASSAHGTDTEDAALEVMLANARRNEVADRCTTSRASVGYTRTYDVVLANILAPVLIELAPVLLSAVAPRGNLLLAGLIEDQVPRVSAAFASMQVVETLTDGNWRCLRLQHRT
jgi:ribosomal protein L11 methyltransferase